MKWLTVFFCCAVSLIDASEYGWKLNKEYVYGIRGRTLTAFHEVQDQYTGVLLSATLIVVARENGTLEAQIVDAKYAPINMFLIGGWNTEIPENELQYIPMPLGEQFFELKVKNGLIQYIVIEKSVEKWKINFIKAVVSNLHLDTTGKTAIENELYQPPIKDEANGVFETLEESISGTFETTYEISPLPVKTIQSDPQLAALIDLRTTSAIEIIKNRNFGKRNNLVYHFGFGQNTDWDINSNDMGEFLSVSSMSRVVINGTLKEYSIQTSSTVEKIFLKPTINSKENGMVVSHLKLILDEDGFSRTDFSEVRNPIRLNSLVGDTLFSPSPEDLLEDYKNQTLNLAQGIDAELNLPEKITKERTPSKFLRIIKMLKHMKEAKIKEIVQKINSWRVVRDTLAEVNSPSTLKIIVDMIKENQISNEEAAEFLEVFMGAIKVPSPILIQSLFSIINSNETVTCCTAILAFSNLVRKVYVDERFSGNHYSTTSSGPIRFFQGGQEIVTDLLLPYLKEELQKAVDNTDSHKILMYTRALGNVGHNKILTVFQPYLEGTKTISQFQRLHMIASLDKLIEINPARARPVLYNIYRNQGDVPEIRTAAVLQLMRTNPPLNMLLRMAQYTNVDSSEQVNSAVKSAIESAAMLKGEQFAQLARNARSAKPMLTKEEYQADYSRSYIRSLVFDNLNILFAQEKLFGTKNSIPKIMEFNLGAEVNEFKQDLFNFKTMISSITDFWNCLREQTEMYQEKQRQQKENFRASTEKEFSSESIFRSLNYWTYFHFHEQLDSTLLFKMGEKIGGFFSISNKTIADLPEAIEAFEEALRVGQIFDYTKFSNHHQRTLMFPTATSFPFIYTLDVPVLWHFTGQLGGHANPRISRNGKLSKPQTIECNLTMNAVVATNIEEKLGFLTSFDNEFYQSYLQRDWKIQIPLRVKTALDLTNKKVKWELAAIDPMKNTEIVHYNVAPSIGRQNFFDMRLPSEMTIIDNDNFSTAFDKFLGNDAAIGFRIKYQGNEKIDLENFNYEIFQKPETWLQILNPLLDPRIRRTSLQIWYNGETSCIKNTTIQIAYDQKYQNNIDFLSRNITNIENIQFPSETETRLGYMANIALEGITSGYLHLLDSSVEFDGRCNFRFDLGAAFVDSRVNKKIRAVAFGSFLAVENLTEKRNFTLLANIHRPETAELDFIEALNSESALEARIDIAVKKMRYYSTVKTKKREVRRKHLQDHPLAKECRMEMKEGNNILNACEKMIAEANLPDVYSVEFGVYLPVDETFVKLFRANLAFESNLQSADLNFGSSDMLEFPVAFELYKDQFVSLMKTYLSAKDYQACNLDKTGVKTFSGKAYPLVLNGEWTVVMHYVPKLADKYRKQETRDVLRQEHQLEEYVILVRRVADERTDFKMTFRTPETKGKVLEIDVIVKYEGVGAKVLVNNMPISNETSTDFAEGFVQVFALSTGNVEVYVCDAYKILFDGLRMKLTLNSNKFEDALRGLCGAGTNSKVDDFTAPKGCVLHSPIAFINSYTLNTGSEESCIFSETEYVKVMSDKSNCDSNLIISNLCD